MLQEEGLVEIEPNQRTRIAGLDPVELDDIYASRILLETLALSMTMGNFGASGRRDAKRLLATMRRAAKTGDFQAWFSGHADFHRLITAATGEALQRQLAALADRTIRYIRIYQLSDPNSWQAAGDVEHAHILESLVDDDEQGRTRGDGQPPGPYRAAGADRLRTGVRPRGRAARGRPSLTASGRSDLSSGAEERLHNGEEVGCLLDHRPVPATGQDVQPRVGQQIDQLSRRVTPRNDLVVAAVHQQDRCRDRVELGP